ERDAALFHKQRDGGGGELFGDGAGDERRGRRDRHAVLEVGGAVALRVGDRAVLKDADGAAGRVGAVESGEDTIDSARDITGELLGDGRRRDDNGEERNR